MDSDGFLGILCLPTGVSSNGRTSDSGSDYRGSNPCTPTEAPIGTTPMGAAVSWLLHRSCLFRMPYFDGIQGDRFRLTFPQSSSPHPRAGRKRGCLVLVVLGVVSAVGCCLPHRRWLRCPPPIRDLCATGRIPRARWDIIHPNPQMQNDIRRFLMNGCGTRCAQEARLPSESCWWIGVGS